MKIIYKFHVYDLNLLRKKKKFLLLLFLQENLYTFNKD